MNNWYYIKRRSKEAYYKTSKKQIADELADILYSIIRIADYYNINLEKAHLEARKKVLQGRWLKILINKEKSSLNF